MSVVCGDDAWGVGPGGFVLLPRGVPHSFSVSEKGPLKLLQITTPSQFERFAAEFGEPARHRSLPPPAAPDVQRLIEVMAKYGYQMAGGPPADA